MTISALTDMTEDYEVRSPRILTSEERKARDALRRAEAEQAMREHEAAQKAFYEKSRTVEGRKARARGWCGRQMTACAVADATDDRETSNIVKRKA